MLYALSAKYADYVWNGSYTVNVFRSGKEIDCFSLDYGNPSPTLVDFAQAVMQHEEDNNV